MDDQNKNFLKATVLSFMVILTWLILFPPEPPADPETTTEVASDATQSVETPDVGVTSTTTAPAQPTEDATVEAARIAIETPELSGSLSLQGGRLDDVYLTEYRETIEEDAETVRLLRPQGENDAYLAVFGWAGNGVNVPDPDTLWSIESGDKLTQETPVVLVWDNGQGLTFRKEINVDDQFMFSITQSVSNATGEEVVLRPYGLIRRHTLPDNLKRFFILHEGLVRMSDGTLEETSYKDIEDYGVSADDGTQAERIEVAESGWIGYTDHYWMTTLIPEQGTPFRSVSKYFASREIYQSEAVMPVETIANGSEVQVTTRLFVGPKEWEAIRTYQDEQGVDRFVDSIDWGWFFFLTKPIFSLLHWLNGVVGNMGWSIIALTLIIKAIVLPLAYKSYVSMAKMKELQPEMEKLKERAGDDRQALQQGMMKLYKENKVNPASGCLPILIQIPIFFSLYKVIFVTIELRHAEWIGWIRDLSAPDPSSILNLFGLLPYGTPEQGSLFAIVSLGVLPILLGISMWLQQKLNPAPTDPTQKMVFAWMPWIFMFMLGSFASGLVLYWIANNTITFLQQYAIMRSHGHKPDVFGNITSSFKRKKAEADTKTPSAKGTKK